MGGGVVAVLAPPALVGGSAAGGVQGRRPQQAAQARTPRCPRDPLPREQALQPHQTPVCRLQAGTSCGHLQNTALLAMSAQRAPAAGLTAQGGASNVPVVLAHLLLLLVLVSSHGKELHALALVVAPALEAADAVPGRAARLLAAAQAAAEEAPLAARLGPDLHTLLVDVAAARGADGLVGDRVHIVAGTATRALGRRWQALGAGGRASGGKVRRSRPLERSGGMA